MFGLYIAEFELRGRDRAVYGDKLLHELPKKEEMERFLAEQIKQVGRGE